MQKRKYTHLKAVEGLILSMRQDGMTFQEIANTLHGVKCVYNDATKPETFLSVVEDVVQDAGHIDVLVNNFGTSIPGKDLDFANTDPQVFLDTVNLNLRSVFMASQAAAKIQHPQPAVSSEVRYNLPNGFDWTTKPTVRLVQLFGCVDRGMGFSFTFPDPG